MYVCTDYKESYPLKKLIYDVPGGNNSGWMYKSSQNSADTASSLMKHTANSPIYSTLTAPSRQYPQAQIAAEAEVAKRPGDAHYLAAKGAREQGERIQP
jgi:hypothetical protein